MKKRIRWITVVLAVALIGILIFTVIQYRNRKQLVDLALQYLNDNSHTADLDRFEVAIEKEKIWQKDHWKIVFSEIPAENGKYLHGWRQKYAVLIDMETKALVRIGQYR